MLLIPRQQKMVKRGEAVVVATIAGRTVRVKREHSKVHAIGHIIKDDWFDPSVEFKALMESSK